MVNPFEYGRELGTNELADREKEVAAVIQTVEQGSLHSQACGSSVLDSHRGDQ